MMSAKPRPGSLNVAQCSYNVQPLETQPNPSRYSLSLTEADYTFNQWLCLKGYGDFEKKPLGRGSYAVVQLGTQYGKGVGEKDEPRAFKVMDRKAMMKHCNPLLGGNGGGMLHVANEHLVLFLNLAVKACPYIIRAYDYLEGNKAPILARRPLVQPPKRQSSFEASLDNLVAVVRQCRSHNVTPAVSGEVFPIGRSPASSPLLVHHTDEERAALEEMDEDADFERIENSIVFVLEYCSEGAVQTILSSQEGTWSPRYSERTAARHNSLYQIMYAVTMAVKCLHTENIIHRDIKPDNILGNGRTYLLSDFGTACYKPMDGWVQGHHGTLSFLSPELCESTGLVQGKPVDIWALGVTFYCLLMGHLPFFGRTLEELFQGISHDEPDFATPTRVVADRRRLVAGGPCVAFGAVEESVTEFDGGESPRPATPKKTSAPFTVPSPELQQLLKGMLTKDPTKRLTIEQVESGVAALIVTSTGFV